MGGSPHLEVVATPRRRRGGCPRGKGRGDSRIHRAVGREVALAGGVGGILDADRPKAAAGVGGTGDIGREGDAHRNAARSLLTRREGLRAPARPGETTERSGAGREAVTREAHRATRAGRPAAAGRRRPEGVAVVVVSVVVTATAITAATTAPTAPAAPTATRVVAVAVVLGVVLRVALLAVALRRAPLHPIERALGRALLAQQRGEEADQRQGGSEAQQSTPRAHGQGLGQVVEVIRIHGRALRTMCRRARAPRHAIPTAQAGYAAPAIRLVATETRSRAGQFAV